MLKKAAFIKSCETTIMIEKINTDYLRLTLVVTERRVGSIMVDIADMNGAAVNIDASMTICSNIVINDGRGLQKKK